jgi:excisionase family DNA binding protein
MLISRRIIYTDSANYCNRIELVFDPPIDIDSPLGKVDFIYKDGTSGAKESTLHHCRPIVNANRLLHVKEVMQAGELLAIRIRLGHRFQDLVIDQSHQIQVIADSDRLQYWITAGRDGVVEVTGEMVKDDEGFFAKLKSNLKDIPYRAYIVQRSLAGAKPTDAVIPSIMNTGQAAAYLGLSQSKTYKLAQSGEIRRTPEKRFRKADLDAYLEASQKPKKRR